MKFFDTLENRLIFVEQKASADFWDDLWNVEDFEKTVKKGVKNKFITKTLLRFLPPNRNTKILEGGCGNGQFVYAFQSLGYDAYGVDYAPKTIARIHSVFPNLQVREGDVRSLDFPANFFDGYWSIGVIEHFFDGYDEILDEMTRVLKPGGYLFVTFPHLSFLRKMKARFGRYPAFDARSFERDKFYQFAFDHQRVVRDIEKRSFWLVEKTRENGIKGLKDEVDFLRPFLQKIYDGKSIFSRILNATLSLLLLPLSSHSILLIFEKKK